ncbi:hypothetical protein FSARC_11426 [Fusarium sarcochroum]|uniref:Uncharacterized protein n=1 Tax=Fusarium sarcochroum TaxID=1208366 RepID=A0A8H4TFH0_9HYPO|nr:hypothetical protein FSARC_11426 [Fusarium sarcochroum]
MVKPASNLGSHDSLPLPSTRAARSASDNSRNRHRVVFISRRLSRVVRQATRYQRREHQSCSSPTYPLSQTNLPSTNPETVMDAARSAVELHPDMTTTEKHDDLKFVSGTSDIENQYRTRFDYGPPSIPGTRSGFECLPMTDPVSSKKTYKAVSPLHESEADLSTPPKGLSRSAFESHPLNRTDVEEYISVTPSQNPTIDKISSNSTTPKVPNVNNQLVEAISRNIVQQLQMLSIKDKTIRAQHSFEQPAHQLSESLENESRTPSQREALDRFTQELHQYAEQTGAKDKLAISTPTPPHSGASLHTISALLPFRSEFKAAGLAITSKDQAKYSSRPTASAKAQATPDQALRFRVKRPHLSQIDRNPGCQSSSTEIPFPVTKDMDEWRYAMVDQDQPQQQKTTAALQVPQTQCTPCHPGDMSQWRD